MTQETLTPEQVIYAGEFILENGKASVVTVKCPVMRETAKQVTLQKYSLFADGQRFHPDQLDAENYRHVNTSSKWFQVLAVSRSEAELREKLISKATEIAEAMRVTIATFDAWKESTHV